MLRIVDLAATALDSLFEHPVSASDLAPWYKNSCT
jgi:hypothetical protein